MPLEFVIIPINKTFQESAYDIQNKIKNSTKITSYILVDTDYDIPFNIRINKWKKNKFHIITIDEDFNESNTIILRLDEKRPTPQAMDVEELLQLIKSFEYETEEIRNENDNSSISPENEASGGCFLM